MTVKNVRCREEISHYQQVVVSLKETIRLMSDIDQVIPRWLME